MKTVILTPDSHCHCSISLHTAQLCALLRQQANNEEAVQFLTFSCADTLSAEMFNKNSLLDYARAAEVINSNYEVCILQYAPEAYGGDAGVYILSLANLLTIPLITIIHKVESEPTGIDREVVGFLAEKSACVMTFSRLGVEFLEHYYKIGRDKILLTNAGVTAFSPLSLNERNALLQIGNSKLIMAVGTMDRGSGFETIINALPAVLKSYDDALLLIVDTGAQRQADKEYAKGLQRLAAQRGVLSAVKFIHVSVIQNDLERLMQAANVYVSTGINENKLEDVFLSWAVNSGAAVLATPTWYAKELLDDHKGKFYAFGFGSELATELIVLLRNTNEVQHYRENATLYGVQYSSELIARKLSDLLRRVAQSEAKINKEVFDLNILPALNLEYINSLWFQVGYLQQSMFDVPDLKSGLSLRTNAMALEVFIKAYAVTSDNAYWSSAKKCLSFIQLMQGRNGNWSAEVNCFGERDESFSEDVIGQLICSLGTFYSLVQEPGMKSLVFDLLSAIVKDNNLHDVKAMALGICGLAKVLQQEQGNAVMVAAFKQWSTAIRMTFPSDGFRDWQWYEDVIGEQMGLVPLALLSACELLKDEELLSLAKRALRFLEKQQANDVRFSLKGIGVAKDKEQSKPINEQSSKEAFWFTLAYSKLFEITTDVRYSKKALQVHNWYLGDNAIGKSLYDITTGGCYAAIAGRSLNPKMTLEAASAYWLSHFALHDLFFRCLIL